MYGYWAHYMLNGDYRKVTHSAFINQNESNAIEKFIMNTSIGGLCGHVLQYGAYVVGINVTNNVIPGAMYFTTADIYREMFRVKERRVTAGVVLVGAIMGNVTNVCGINH